MKEDGGSTLRVLFFCEKRSLKGLSPAVLFAISAFSRFSDFPQEVRILRNEAQPGTDGVLKTSGKNLLINGKSSLRLDIMA
jgi:hypothetical protein